MGLYGRKVRALVMAVILLAVQLVAAGQGEGERKAVHVRALLAGGKQPLNPRAATVLPPNTIWVATAEDDLVRRVNLATGEREVLPLPPVSGLASGPEGVWIVPEGERSLIRVDRNGNELQRVPTPFVPTDVAVLPDGTVCASGVRPATTTVLWCLRGRRWKPMPVEVAVSSGDPATREILSTLKLDGGARGIAVVFPLQRSELAVVSPEDRVYWKALPYFAAAWAPLGAEQPSLVDPKTVARLPKPYADVLLLGDRVYCLSFQDGPWQGPLATRRGRHLVTVRIGAEAVDVAELPFDGCQLVELDGGVGVVDERLGVWKVKGAAR